MDNKKLDFYTIMGFVVGAIALIIGIENLEENRRQSDEQEKLLKYLENHLQAQDNHLKSQDELLKERREGGN